jgi:hypothetical protein
MFAFLAAHRRELFPPKRPGNVRVPGPTRWPVCQPASLSVD